MSPIVRLQMRRLNTVQRFWYWQLRVPAPLSVGSTGPWHEIWARLLPQCWSQVHRAYARRYGFFWLPCVLCDRHYGGHQGGGTIPDPTEGAGRFIIICPRCTRAGHSFEVKDPS